MIKNVIFDFGQVMVHFEPDYMVAQYVSDPADRELIASVLFDRLYWDALDRGTIADSEVISASRARLPERLRDYVEPIYNNWIYNIPEIEGMRALVRQVRERYGARVFLLSNISTYFASHASEIPCLSEFEDCVFSAVCGRVKPHADIFQYLCDKNGLIPSECLFVDDNAANIAGAEAFGIHGYLFDGDVARLEAELETLFSSKSI